MTLISLQQVSKDFGIKTLLDQVDLEVGPQDRLGLIGINGSGKSTLLRVMAGLEPVGDGRVQINPRHRVIYVDQNPSLDPERTVLEQVFADCGEKMQLVERYEGLIQELEQSPNDSALLGELSQISNRMDEAKAWELERQCQEVLSRLGICDHSRKVGELSGGYRKRLALASALVAEPDGLLLDEPTNHLDALATEWLQGFLQRFKGALVLITHDRYFLERVTDTIIELDGGQLRRYPGNYGAYLKKKDEEEVADAARQRAYRSVMRREIEWLKRGPKARSTKQKARIQRIEQMQEQSFKPAKQNVAMESASRRLGKTVIDVEHLQRKLGDRCLINDFTYSFSPEDRVGFIGPNGMGKSTLLDLISGRQQPDAGSVVRGETVVIGRFDQHSEDLKPELKVIEVIQDVAERIDLGQGNSLTASQLLERFLFPPAQQHSPVAKLSGGERRRLHLCRLLMAAPNVLLLDEPTNDLDVQTLAVLEDYIEDFRGCVVIVSHDRYFLDRTVDRLFCFQSGGLLERFEGNYSEWLEQQPAKQATESTKTKQAAAKPKREQPKRRSYKEQRELSDLDTKLPQLEEQKTQLELQLAGADYDRLEALTEELAELCEQISRAEDRWLELSALPE
ncbi:ABC-F family ATP-binding cassette domain-containing protein [Synechococcus sp. Minos11]|uniref:ABC-F family ATP-binding cassette domain-containing protein n=1 Tax=Synechococcus sp. Minos11 TaxID=221341 RepID=UPI0016487AB7|nr:ABC-F family ATP-binding cassette domain-containing protein [Synechococcus sp. Minos11]